VDLISQILGLVDVIAQFLGRLAVRGLHFIVPAGAAPPDLAAPIGWLILLTALVALSEVAKKVVWIVVGVGWLLVVLRIVVATVKA
jgi:hypothetical protein